eukprot:TRINITY_DN6314_c0_g1_i1.p1 TRINITY_DN6314_c0_g1~~TRINITY_DN6314_c0_g1_i1.p1  ORF type:complete len:153 (-),score=30.67 TRINITY_DN6314_c0_g1_i1:144-572(-)
MCIRDSLIFRRDGILIDGRPDGYSRRLYESGAGRDGVLALDSNALPLHAVGSLINHPPGGVMPNVVTTPLDLPRDMSPEMLNLFRNVNVNFRTPAESDFALRTVVLVAKTDLENEELWLDYQLSGDTKPQWYTPVEYHQMGC